MRHWTDGLDRGLGRILDVAAWLALPLALLLVLQWPLRDVVRAWSRDANDMAQWIFALYVGLAITAATRAHTHLAVDLVAHSYPARLRAALARAGRLVAIVPWSLYVLVVAAPQVVQSVRQLEGFPDTYNPGYFLIRIAVALLAAALLAQAVIHEFRPGDSR